MFKKLLFSLIENTIIGILLSLARETAEESKTRRFLDKTSLYEILSNLINIYQILN